MGEAMLCLFAALACTASAATWARGMRDALASPPDFPGLATKHVPIALAILVLGAAVMATGCALAAVLLVMQALGVSDGG